MSLIVKKSSETVIAPLEAGVYIGTCIGIADMGKQLNEMFKKYVNKVMLFFEISGETVVTEDGEVLPRWLSREFTLSLNSKSALYKTLKSWRGRDFSDEELDGGFDLRVMLNTSCQLQIDQNEGKNGRVYNSIANFMGLPNGYQVPNAKSELFIFDMDENGGDEKALEKMPVWVRERIKKSPDWAKKAANSEDIDIDIDIEKQPAANAEDVPF